MIAIGCDHGGYEIKQAIIDYFNNNGIEYKDFGCHNSVDSVDYPKYGYQVAKAVADKKCECGILCCGTGIGISIAANKVNGIRAATVTNEFCAEMTKRHNNTNVLCMGGRVISKEMAIKCTEIFLKTPFDGGRHEKRVNMITDIENGNFEI